LKGKDRDAVAYVLWRLGCTHPFKLSRLLAMADILSLERRGRRLTGLRYVPGPGTFYIEGLKDMFEHDPCFEPHRGDPETRRRGCVEYKCDPPRLDPEDTALLDHVIDKYGDIDEMELNRLAINHPLFPKIAG